MTLPRLALNLEKIEHNARSLVTRLARSGITVTGVTKALLGEPNISAALLQCGVSGLGDSRVTNIERLRKAGIRSEIALIRTPMLSQVDRIVKCADVSFNTELDVINALSAAAGKSDTTHGVMLMVELGDLREGILAGDLLETVKVTLGFPNIHFRGIGTNLACVNGVSPDMKNMKELSSLADSVDERFGAITDIVSGGNSANLNWALSGADTGRINNLRLGEAILFGREALAREPIDGLYIDAITLMAEVIELKTKPSMPRGKLAQDAFGAKPQNLDRGLRKRAIVAVGRQDVDITGIAALRGFEIVGSSSDHLVLDVGSNDVVVGDVIAFRINYSAFLRAMASQMAWVEEGRHYQNVFRGKWLKGANLAG